VAARPEADRGAAAGARGYLILILRSGLLAASRRMAAGAYAAILRDAARGRGSSG
jgi:hypothetical protein